MSKLLIFIGSVIIFHTIIAMATGIPQITDYMPIEWFFDMPNGTPYFFKVVPSSEPSYLWLYTVAIGGIFLISGSLLFYLKKRGAK